MPAVIERNVDPHDALTRAGRSLDAYRMDVEYIAANKDDLTTQYPNEWIAVFDGKVVAHSRLSKEFTRILRQSGFAHRSPAIYFLTTKPMTLIL